MKQASSFDGYAALACVKLPRESATSFSEETLGKALARPSAHPGPVGALRAAHNAESPRGTCDTQRLSFRKRPLTDPVKKHEKAAT